MSSRSVTRAQWTLVVAALGLLVSAGVEGSEPQRQPVALGKLERVEFQPARGELLKIPVELSTPGKLRLEVITGDGDTVRVLEQPQQLKPGLHTLQWDGRDERGVVVPDEAYHLVLHCTCQGRGQITLDTRRTTGGYPVEDLATSFSGDGAITYELKEPSRVLVRLGAKGGALMRVLESWTPKAPGSIRQNWDGYDSSGVERLAGKESIVVMVTGFSLPAQTVITSGNAALDYAKYRRQLGWGLPEVEPGAIKLERNGRRLVKQSQLPTSMLRDPRITFELAEKVPRREDGAFVVSGPVTFRVTVPNVDDKWILQQSLYEVSFFLDQQFISEEETGYTPLNWRWTPSGSEQGRHIMTVNVSGFWGHVGVASIPVWIEKK